MPPAGALERLERYLAQLPGGLDAYPAAQAKASLVRNALAGQSLAHAAPMLPPPLVKLVLEPPVESEWVPEVHFTALLHALADIRGMADAAVCAWARERNRALFRTPAYRILMTVASPAAMVRFAGRRWTAWHRGTELAVEGAADDGVRATLRFPDGLFDALAVRIYAEAFAAALEMANARSPEVRIETEARGFARYVARW